MANKKEIQKISDKIVKGFKPEKIILFGSYAWGKPHEDSDVDLFIMKKTKNIRQTARDIDGYLFPRQFPIDILVYTPEQTQRRLKIKDFFIEEIINKGKILYECQS